MAHLFIFEVQGRRRFPIDMLRYDKCWPHRQEDVANIEEAHLGYSTEPWKIRLVSTRMPTPARWRSFQWDLDPKTVTKVRS